jgi:uncharacterized protein (DUF2062 family)
MIHLTRKLVRRWLDQLLHIDDTPERTAAAFALGVFFGFSPLLGLHTVLAIAVAFLLNLNRVAAVLGVYSNLPWIIGPYYVIATMVGAQLTGHRIPRGFRGQLRGLFELSMVHGEFWRRLFVELKPLAVPYLVGSTVGALLLSAAAYQVALAFVKSRRRLRDLMHHHHENS